MVLPSARLCYQVSLVHMQGSLHADMQLNSPLWSSVPPMTLRESESWRVCSVSRESRSFLTSFFFTLLLLS
jgi:hypothetical protein